MRISQSSARSIPPARQSPLTAAIIGFGLRDARSKTIYEYDDIRGDSHAVSAANINPYLVDALDLVLPRRDKPVCAVPEYSTVLAKPSECAA